MLADAFTLAGPSHVTTEVLAGSELHRLGAEWDLLALNALETNPFFSRPYVLSGLGRIDDPLSLKGVCVFLQRPDRTARLIGLVPLRRSKFRYGLPLAVDLAAQNLYQTSGTPLIDRDHAEAAADAILAALHGRRGMARRLLIPNLRGEGPVARLLMQRAERAGLQASFAPELPRPILRPRATETSERYFERVVAAKRLRELRRTHRRLGEVGQLAYRHTADPAEFEAALEDFLRIELSGWKGREGTALRCLPKAERFARDAFRGEINGIPLATADVLSLDGVAIAVSLNLQVGRTACAIKCAFDENYRRFSPGLVLEYLIVEHLFATRYADEIDSCVTESGHVIQGLWDGEATVGTLALSAPGLGSALDLGSLERRRRQARARAKAVYHHARERIPEIARQIRAIPADLIGPAARFGKTRGEGDRSGLAGASS
jgi:hypothetical protein